MTGVETTVRNLAAIAAVKKLLAEAEATEKAKLAAQVKRGTIYAYTSAGDALGYGTIPKPSKPAPTIVVTDEAQMFAWMVEEFGPEVIEERVQLTEQGRKSFNAYVLEAHKADGAKDHFDLPGVSVTVGEAKPPVPRFTPDKNVVALVRGMIERGELHLPEVLAIGGPDA